MNAQQRTKFRSLIGRYGRSNWRAKNDAEKQAAWNTFAQSVQKEIGIAPEQLSEWFQQSRRNAEHREHEQQRNSRRPKKTHDTTD
ncbi:hypothetical protein [Lacticaseibacillus saniviri]